MTQPFRTVSGPLTLDSFNGYAAGLFARSRKTTDDPLQIGWRATPPRSLSSIALSRVSHSSAEGIVTLANCLAALLATVGGIPLKVESDAESDRLSEVFDIGQFVTGEWQRLPAATFRFLTDESFALPLRRVAFAQRADCGIAARDVVSALDTLPPQLLPPNVKQPLSIALRAVLTEVFANIFDHTEARCGLIAAVVAPSTVHGRPVDTADAEIAWLKNAPLHLEVAVSDSGCGIPFQLHRNFLDRYRTRLEAAASGTDLNDTARADLHREVCAWAFRHDSTSKATDPDSAAWLSWRGLHRCWNHVAARGGAFVLASGRARVGYVCDASRALPFEHSTPKGHELPGTLAVVRLPLTDTQTTTGAVGSDDQERPAHILHPAVTVVWPKETDGDVRAFNDAIDTSQRQDANRIVAVLHRFEPMELTRVAGRGFMLRSLRALQGSSLSLHLFTDVSEQELVELVAYADRWTDAEGSPRLLGFVTPSGRVSWTMAGLLPSQAADWARSLMRDGFAPRPSDPVAASFAELVRTDHSQHIALLPEGGYRLLTFGAKLHSGFAKDALDTAFARFVEPVDTNSAVYVAPNDELVRLNSGRLVGRYLSVTALVEHHALLRRSLAALLREELSRLRERYGDFRVVVPSLASYYLFMMLTGEQRQDLRPVTVDRAEGLEQVVLFGTAVSRGDTFAGARTALGPHAQLLSCLACLDLRHGTPPAPWPLTEPLAALIRFPFDPKEIPNNSSARLPGHSEREVCSVTDWPAVVEASLSTIAIDRRAEALASRPQTFRYGLQCRGARLHVVTLPIEPLLEQAKALVLAWFVDNIRAVLDAARPRRVHELVLAFSPNSSIASLLPELGRTLMQDGADGNLRVSLLAMPAIPQGPDVIYARPGSPLLSRRRGVYELLPPSDIAEYAAIYIDGAAISGKTFRAFVDSVMSDATSTPVAVGWLPLVMRLNPSEAGWYFSVTQIGRRSIGPEAAFYCSSLFRLQVRSYERVEDLAVAAVVQGFLSSGLRHDPRLEAYLDALHDRLDALAEALRSEADSEVCITHPFSPPTERSADIASVPADAVAFRHLLALHQQNRGVLPLLLRTLQEATNRRDFGFLSVLAVEPDLLNKPPLILQARNAIAQFAVDALAAPSTALGTKSDALAVLAFLDNVLVDRFPEVLVVLKNWPNLLPQCLCHLAIVLDATPNLRSRLRRAIASIQDPSLADRTALVLAFVDSRAERTRLMTISDEETALDAIHSAIQRLLRHSADYQLWRSVHAEIRSARGGGLAQLPDALALAQEGTDALPRGSALARAAAGRQIWRNGGLCRYRAGVECHSRSSSWHSDSQCHRHRCRGRSGQLVPPSGRHPQYCA